MPAAFAALEILLYLPDRERAQPGPGLALRESGNLRTDECVELGGLLVAGGQDAGADERGAQVGGALPALDGVEGFVGELDLAACELPERPVARADHHPVEHRPGLRAVAERGQIGPEALDGARIASVGEQLEPLGEGAAGAAAVGVVLLLGAAAATDLADALAGATLADLWVGGARAPAIAAACAVER